MDEYLISEFSGTNRRRLRFAALDHFKRIENSKGKTECLYCGLIIGCFSAQRTSGMHNHLGRCKNYPYANVDKSQKMPRMNLLGW